MSLQLELAQDRFAPGDWIAGTVFAHGFVPARSLAVHVTLFESTRDYTEEALTGWTGHLHQGPIPERSSFPFQLQLPPDVPPPYRSEWGELYWEVDAKADVAGGTDEHARQRILVLPPGVAEDSLVHPGALARPGVVAATAASPPGSLPAGWHPDPWLHKRLRWWDGDAWTGHTAD